jgi:hypothetical protein
MITRLKIYIPFLAIFVFWLIFFREQIFLGKVFYCCDNFLINVPAKIFLASEIKSGRFPFWNPNILSGTPYLADINLGALYPFNLLYILFPPFSALTINIIIHILLLTYGTYLTIRSFGVSKYSAIVSGIIFGFSGTAMVYIDNTSMLQAVTWLPWSMYFINIFIQKMSSKSYLGSLFFLTLQVYAGHPQITFYSWLFVLFLIISIGSDRIVIKLKILFKIFIPVLLLGGVQLIPFIEFAVLSTRLGRGWEYATFGSLNPLMLIRFLIPAISGNPDLGTNWLLGSSLYGYLGILPLLLIFTFFPRNRNALFLIFSSLIAILLSMGKFSPLYLIAYYLIPGIASFRVPTHFLLIYTFSLSILTGICLDKISDVRFMIWSKIRVIIIYCSFFIFMTFCFWLTSLLPPTELKKLFMIPIIGDKLARINIADIPLLLASIAKDTVILGLIVFGFVLIIISRLSKWSKVIFIGLLCFVDIFYHNYSSSQIVPREFTTRLLDNVSKLESQIPGLNIELDRVYVDKLIYPSQIEKQQFSELAAETIWQSYIIRPNLGTIGRIMTPDGYSSMILISYHDYWDRNNGDPTGIYIDPLTEKLKSAGVKYVFTTYNNSLFQTSNFMPIHTDYVTSVYQVLASTPRIFMEKGSDKITGGINIIRDVPNQIIISIDVKNPVKLVLLDTNYPGWKATIDGQSTKILPYNTIFKSVRVPSGLHQVQFIYDPISIKIGLLISFIGIIVSLAIGKKFFLQNE